MITTFNHRCLLIESKQFLPKTIHLFFTNQVCLIKPDNVGPANIGQRFPQRTGRQETAISHTAKAIKNQNIVITVQAQGMESVVQNNDFSAKLFTGKLCLNLAAPTRQNRNAGKVSRQKISLVSGMPYVC